jgi:hypothetical protein
MEDGEQTTATELIVGAEVTVTVAEPDWLESCVDVAMILAVPALVGVNTPVALTDPREEGVTDHVTASLKFPVPVTVGVQDEVWFRRIDEGVQVTETPVTADGALTVTAAEFDWEGSCVDVAVIVAFPVAVGVKTPVSLTEPAEDGLTDQDTELL